jgi:transposase
MQSIQTRAGIDVSAKTLAVCRCRDGNENEQEFSNDAVGHRELLKWLGRQTRVCMEATGVYHLQLALMLSTAPRKKVSRESCRVRHRGFDFGEDLGKGGW